MKKLVFCLVMILSLMIAGAASADLPNLPGSGTAADPYQVRSAAELNYVRMNLDAHYIQLADIDLSGMLWEPIGGWNEDDDEDIGVFSGSYNGNGYAIRNMTIEVSDNRAAVGLFGVLSGEVRDVHLENCSVTVDKTAMDYLGDGWERFQANGIGTHIISGSPSFRRRVCAIGTLVGTTYGQSASIVDCSAEGVLTAEYFYDAEIGGLIGLGDGESLISDVRVQARNIAGTCASSLSLGGVTGNGSVENSIYINKIFVIFNDGQADIGGICGSYGDIRSCVNRGYIQVTIEGIDDFASHLDCGGIAGAAPVSDSVNYGDIVVLSSYNKNFPAYVGGIAGGAYTSVTNCLNMAQNLSLFKKTNGYTHAYRVGWDQCSSCYSVDYTLVNGVIPNEYIGADQYNGASLTREEALAFIAQLPLKLPTDAPVDTDEDGLYDDWETNGIDTDGDGVIDVPLHLMGADPSIPDVFVEIDWMEKQSIFGDKSYAPDPRALQMVYEAYAAHGIRLHLDAGPDSVDHVTGKRWGELSGGNSFPYKENIYYRNNEQWGDWLPLSKKYFASEREAVFKYCLYVDKAYNENDYVYGLALVPYGMLTISDLKNQIDEASCFMHELGHAMGLPDDSPRYKVNNLSVMNYIAVHYDGLITSNGQRIVNYSEYMLPALDENHLDECLGIDPLGETEDDMLGVKFLKSGWERRVRFVYLNPIAKSGIDFDQDGVLSNDVKCDLNGDGQYTILPASFDEWAALRYDYFLAKIYELGTENAQVMADPPYEQLRREGAFGGPGDAEIERIMPSVLYASSKGQALTLTLKNLTPSAAQVTLTVESDVVGGKHTEEISLPASEDGFVYGSISIPVPETLAAGQYSLDVTLDCHNGTVTEKSYPVVVEAMPSIELAAGESYTIDGRNDPDALSWESSAPNVAVVSDGTITAKAGGTAIITVTNPDGDLRAWLIAVDIAFTQPQDQYVTEGQKATFQIAVPGTQIQYQWYVDRNDGRGWTAIPGATASTYTTDATTLSDDGQRYCCEFVADAGNKHLSNGAVLHVIPVSTVPLTGDSAPVLLWLSVAFLSAAMAGGLCKRSFGKR